MFTSHKQGNCRISGSPILKAFVTDMNKSYAKLSSALHTVAIRVLLLPLSTAVVEHFLSLKNRVLITKLMSNQLDDTMFIGSAIPNGLQLI